MVTIREHRRSDLPQVWTMATLPNVGDTADPLAPLPLPAAAEPPAAFPALACPERLPRGTFLVGDLDGHVVATGGLQDHGDDRAEVVFVRVHPATRRRGIGRRLMTALEQRAAALGYMRTVLNTATNQPEAVAFYRALGYHDVRTETRREWHWTVVHFEKPLLTDSHGTE
ncbi:GNAT family N-acetyltransferase [Phytoactinopolyspora halotolerans]|uniref:GNAT family N-acetyltransferase n=1 Tax=Phytoactinopolyspora halotolerans TaxID=1981512 RepID=A0A6L9SEF9_9ACTN|nr:GNAT family N-acetyltransferase [Phytoactinopolyspora halotolerans]NEE03795.1 GNAT family N-acetyltransferase [Phytoactinopolyspora halotolerans]